MIFVTIGTTEPFDRLLVSLASLTDEELLIQCGDSSVTSEHATYVDYLSYDEVAENMRRARLVVAHAGVGTVLTALANGKRPVVVPRRAVFGEAVDDHQVELARRLAMEGLVTLVEDPSDLGAAVRSADPVFQSGHGSSTTLAGELREYIGSVIRSRSPSRGP